MVTSLDRDADGRISQEEFRLFCSRLAQGLATHSGGAAEALNSLSDVLFTVCDHNANGTMSEGEFVQFARAHGSSDAVAAAGFRLIDRDRNGTISLEEWRHFMHDLFQSRKLNDAAAVVFGPGSRGAS
jgi:Ca2+-binding EF-hand superfamily protein